MAKKGRKKKDDSSVPLNLLFDKDKPEHEEIAALLENGFDLGLLSPASGSVLITEKKIIGTIALNRLVADLKEAKARQVSSQESQSSQRQAEPDNTEKPVNTPVMAKKRSIADLNQFMQEPR